MKKKILALLLAVLLVAALAACGGGGTTTPTPAPPTPAPPTGGGTEPTPPDETIERQTIRIAINTHFTGAAARGAQSQYQGWMVALNQIVAEGLSRYYDFEVIRGDDENNPAGAASIANRSAHLDHVHVVYGHLNAVQTLAGLPVYEEAGIPVLTPSVALTIVQSGFDYVFQITPNDLITARTITRFLVLERGYDNIAILYSANEQGFSGRDAIARELAEHGLEFGIEEQYGVTDIDFSGQILRIRESGAQAVILWGGDPAGRTIMSTQIRQLFDYDITIAGDTQVTTSSFLGATSPEIREGIYAVVAWCPSFTDPMSVRFVEEFRAMDAENAAPGDMAARGHDAMYLLVTALNNLGPYDVNAPTFRSSLRDAIRAAHFYGLQGLIQPDAVGASVHSSHIARISYEGTLEVIWTEQ